MAAPDMSMPPIPPDVRAQQAPPQIPAAMQFAQGPGPEAGAGMPAFDPMVFASERMNQVAELLTEVAKVLVVENPALIPLVKQMAKVGGALQNELQASVTQGAPGSNPNEQPTQTQLPESENAASGVSMG